MVGYMTRSFDWIQFNVILELENVGLPGVEKIIGELWVRFKSGKLTRVSINFLVNFWLGQT